MNGDAMKRDMDLVRQILIDVEEHGPAGHGWVEIEVPGVEPEVISAHVKLLHDAGYVEATDRSHMQALVWQPKRLTWEGHELLEAIRNETVWSKTKKAVADKGGSIPFEIVKELAITIARDYFLGP
jgi:hypothetical protein